MRTSVKSLGVGAAALVLTAFLPTTANAATLQPSCGTTGANGNLRVENFGGATDHINVSMTTYDTLADGKNPAIRLLTKNVNGKVKYWAWHVGKGGKGSWGSWKTYAKEDTGIFEVGVQIARFDGGNLVNSCTDWS
ncbi:hypothetical protein ACFY12_21590 [Streptomyces sp. NPDC001339]|uniref:hypothetical protein n=1 Tax=Streptomyces sp. NPDC001339 TaxID=3364563 RepID=UPI0036A9BCA9